MPTSELTRSRIAERAAILSEATAQRRALARTYETAMRELAGRGDWQGALVAVKSAGFSEAQVARRLDVMRSTVNRWLRGKTEPPPESVPGFVEALSELMWAGVVASAAQAREAAPAH
jgi:DNA-binding transcriptional regulator YiaG